MLPLTGGSSHGHQHGPGGSDHGHQHGPGGSSHGHQHGPGGSDHGHQHGGGKDRQTAAKYWLYGILIFVLIVFLTWPKGTTMMIMLLLIRTDTDTDTSTSEDSHYSHYNYSSQTIQRRSSPKHRYSYRDDRCKMHSLIERTVSGVCDASRQSERRTTARSKHPIEQETQVLDCYRPEQDHDIVVESTHRSLSKLCIGRRMQLSGAWRLAFVAASVSCVLIDRLMGRCIRGMAVTKWPCVGIDTIHCAEFRGHKLG